MAKTTRCCTLVASGWHHPPAFLAPTLARDGFKQFQSAFSTTSTLSKNHRDRSRKRGISAIRGTGPRYPLSVSGLPLPKPVLDPAKRTKIQSDPNHGLWQFFGKDRQAMVTPEDMAAHGRSWAVEELRHKSWEDLHSLWWVCAKERNRIATAEYERQRVNAGYGQFEAQARDQAVVKTQKAIKHVLTERWYAYTNAWKEAQENPEMMEQIESPTEFLEEDILSENLASSETNTDRASGPAAIKEDSLPQEVPREERPRT